MTGTRGAVVVTGASKGIGRACALLLDQAGFRVFAGVRKETDAESLRESTDGRVIPVMIEVVDAAGIAEAAAFVSAETGGAGIDGLVNNAGIVIAGPLEFLPIDELRRQLEVNVVGQVAVTQAFLPLLRRARGRIVNMGSISGRSSLPFTGPYSAAKHALEAITDSLRVELLPSGIEVIIIEPGAVATPIWATSIATAERILTRMPARAHELYGRMTEVVKRSASESGARGIPADAVAAVVMRALTEDRPRTRYVVGRDARVRLWLERLPDRWRDRLIAARLKLRSHGRG